MFGIGTLPDDLLGFLLVKSSPEFVPALFHFAKVTGNAEQVRFKQGQVPDLFKTLQDIQDGILHQVFRIPGIAGDRPAKPVELVVNRFVMFQEFSFCAFFHRIIVVLSVKLHKDI